MIRLAPGDAGYPSGLTDLRTPPALWLRGALPDRRCVAVVGTRQPDRTGVAAAEAVTAALVERGYGIVSGLAAGIDATAHRVAVAAGGRTWAVVGTGADVIPPDAVALADAMTDPTLGGGVISELEPGTPSSRQTLVARDRLQSALSLAVVVVQTDRRSGTMHTARFAVVQGRPLVVVSPPRPGGGPPARPAAWAGNAALTDPGGCDPALLKATGAAARLIGARRPVADLIIPGAGPWPQLWQLLASLEPAAGADRPSDDTSTTPSPSVDRARPNGFENQARR